MCHQSVGLIARTIETAGIPTVALTSAWSITASVNTPRAAFVDYPLGHTAGRVHDPDNQDLVVRSALARLREATEPGTISTIPLSWPHDRWRSSAMAGDSESLWVTAGSAAAKPAAQGESAEKSADQRMERHPTPQYQNDDDAERAAARLGADVACAACVGFDH